MKSAIRGLGLVIMRISRDQLYAIEDTKLVLDQCTSKKIRFDKEILMEARQCFVILSCTSS